MGVAGQCRAGHPQRQCSAENLSSNSSISSNSSNSSNSSISSSYIIINSESNRSSERIRISIVMEEGQVNGSFRSVIKVNGGDAEESNSLFPSHLLDKLHEENADKVPTCPPLGPGLLLRPLLLSDFNSGFLSLLTQLTSVGEVTWQQWEERWSQLKSASNHLAALKEHHLPAELLIKWSFFGQ